MQSLITAITAILTLTSATPPSPGVTRHDVPDAEYLDLAQQPQFASVALVQATGQPAGSAVLIAPDWLITAAHVIKDNPGATFDVRFGDAKYRVDRMALDVDHDLALLHLDTPVADIKPALRYRGNDEAHRTGTSVGFGCTGHGDETIGAILDKALQTVGTKRAGQNVLDEVEGDLIQADFDHPADTSFNQMGEAKPLRLEYLPYSGDSGGGLFIRENGVWYLVGVTTAGMTPRKDSSGDGFWQHSLAYGWIAQWHRVSQFNSWIDRVTNTGT